VRRRAAHRPLGQGNGRAPGDAARAEVLKFLFVLLLAASAGAGAAPALIFASAEEASAILGADDDYLRATRPLERRAKLRSPQPVDAAHYRQYLASQGRDWTEDERRRLATLNVRLERFLETLKLRMPERILLVKAGMERVDSAPHTRANAIVLPQAFLDAAQPAELVYVMGHELFHVLSRHDEQAREQLYATLGFQRCARTEVPEAVERLRITNPDAIDDRHTIRVRYRGEQVEAMPLLMLRSADFDPAQGFIANAHDPWLIMERRDGACRARLRAGVAQSAKAAELEGLFEQIGRNTAYLIHPEEIVADNFAALAIAFSSGKPAPLPSPEVIERMRPILFAPRSRAR
jgi:hypothetical protein